MERIKKTPSLASSSVALGCFDGMHIGHMAVLSAAFDAGNHEEHPCGLGDMSNIVFTARPTAKYEFPVWTPDDHARLMAEAGAELWVTPDFDSIRNLSPEDFVGEILADKLRAVRVACGYNFRFGKDAAGGAEDLLRLCDARGIECIVVPEVRQGGKEVSTTAIRHMLAAGDVESANAMLGRRFGYTLPVIEGKKLGRTLGAPTLNQSFNIGAAASYPRFGVYASCALAENTWRYSVTNFGLRPTIGDVEKFCPISETWVPEFAGDLYGQNIRVEWLKFIRGEEKFGSLDELRGAIFADAEAARQIYGRAIKND